MCVWVRVLWLEVTRQCNRPKLAIRRIVRQVRSLRQHAEALRLRPQVFVCMGHSAGPDRFLVCAEMASNIFTQRASQSTNQPEGFNGRRAERQGSVNKARRWRLLGTKNPSGFFARLGRTEHLKPLGSTNTLKVYMGVSFSGGPWIHTKKGPLKKGWQSLQNMLQLPRLCARMRSEPKGGLSGISYAMNDKLEIAQRAADRCRGFAKWGQSLQKGSSKA